MRKRNRNRNRASERRKKNLSGFMRKEKNRNEFSIEKHRKEENRTPKVAEKK